MDRGRRGRVVLDGLVVADSLVVGGGLVVGGVVGALVAAIVVSLGFDVVGALVELGFDVVEGMVVAGKVGAGMVVSDGFVVEERGIVVAGIVVSLGLVVVDPGVVVVVEPGAEVGGAGGSDPPAVKIPRSAKGLPASSSPIAFWVKVGLPPILLRTVAKSARKSVVGTKASKYLAAGAMLGIAP